MENKEIQEKSQITALKINKASKRVETLNSFQLYENGQRVYSPSNKPSPDTLGAVPTSAFVGGDYNHLGATHSKVGEDYFYRYYLIAEHTSGGRIDYDVEVTIHGDTNYNDACGVHRIKLSRYTGDSTGVLHVSRQCTSGNPDSMVMLVKKETGKTRVFVRSNHMWGDIHAKKISSPFRGQETNKLIDGTFLLSNDSQLSGLSNIPTNCSFDGDSGAVEYFAVNGIIRHRGTEVSDLFLGKTSKATDSERLDGIDSTSFLRSDADDSFSGALISTARDKGLFGTYDSNKTDQIWSMGAAYKNSSTGANFGNLYGLAYKHTNNTTGGTMAGGHQMVWCTNGTPKAALGDSGIWTSGTISENGQRVYSPNNKPSPSTLGAVNKAGDTMTGNLTITSANADPKLIVHRTNLDGNVNIGFKTQSGNITYFGLRSDGHFGYKTDADVSSGNKIYSTGFKPNSDDTGSLAKNRGQVTSNDWNTLTNAGSYSVNNASGANKPAVVGCPTVYNYGTLFVQNNGTTINQLYLANNGTMWVRDKWSSNAWRNWTQVLTGDSYHISTSVNLDDYSSTGFYNMYKGSGVTFTNAPSEFSYGTLQVIGRGRAGASFVTQIVTYRESGRQMIRTRNDGGMAWTPWKKIYSESQKPTASDVGLSNVPNTVHTTAATANTVAVRDSAADINVRLVRSNYQNQNTISGAMAFRVNNSSDNYVRFCSDTGAIRTWLSTYSKSESDGRYAYKAGSSSQDFEGKKIKGHGTGNDYHTGAFEAIGNGSTNTVYPTYGFHQPGMYASSIQLRGAAQFHFIAQGASSHAHIYVHNVNLYGGVISNGGGSSWISQKTASDVPLQCTGQSTQGDGGTYKAAVRFNGRTKTYTMGSIANIGMGFYGYNNGTTANQTDFSCSMDGSGNWKASGNVGAYSDKRVKTNIVKIENALDKVTAIGGYTYDRTDIDDGKRHVGVIAQEVEAVMPELVDTFHNHSNGIKDFKSVNYGNITALLIEAIKELKDEIEVLKNAA